MPCNINSDVVAQWFLSKQSMEHKKLQKLCYYAQAWHCALEGSPLFMDRIEAWVHGPVIPVLYHKYKSYGWQQIPQIKFDESTLPESAKDILEAVYETYGGLTGEQLETLSHSEAPWQNARGNKLLPFEPSTNLISIDDMREYYLKQYQDAQND